MKKNLIILLFILLTGCAKQNDQPGVSQNQVKAGIEVYKEYITLTANDTFAVTNTIKLLDSALTLHKMEKDEFIKVLQYCEKNPEIMQDALTDINATLNSVAETPTTRAKSDLH